MSVAGRGRSSVILHVPHSSRDIPPDVREDIVLTDQELSAELDRMTDSFTDVIAERVADAVKTNSTTIPTIVAAPVSRLVVDVERFIDGSEPMESVGMGAVYTRTSDDRVLRERVDPALLGRYFYPHAQSVEDAVTETLAEHGTALVIDVHSYPTNRLPYELAGPGDPRPEICLDTDAAHTPSWLEAAAREAFSDFSVEVNSPFAGAYVPLKHHGSDHRVRAIMVEIRRDQYMDESAVALHTGTDRVADAIAQLVRAATLVNEQLALPANTGIVERARLLAVAAHAGQTDKAGVAYWKHPSRVAGHVRSLYPDAPDAAVAVAWLHDVVEDTLWTAAALRDVGVPDDVVDAVVLLTRTDDVAPDEYYARLARNGGLALKVKHADIADNLDESRLAALDQAKAEMFRTKYAKALELLGLEHPWSCLSND